MSRVDAHASNLRKLQIYSTVLRRSHGALRANVDDPQLRAQTKI